MRWRPPHRMSLDDRPQGTGTRMRGRDDRHDREEDDMNKTAAALTAGLAGLTLAGGALLPSASGVAPAPPIVVEPLTSRSTFTDDVSLQVRLKLDGQRTTVINVARPSRTVVARITAQTDAQFPWHSHPGPVLVTVVTGELTYVNANDCVERVYPAGTTFVDPGRGNVHTAFNSADHVTELIATFYEVPAQGPLTITAGVSAPEDCHVGVGSHSSH